jgi:hypothetical protein
MQIFDDIIAFALLMSLLSIALKHESAIVSIEKNIADFFISLVKALGI